LVTVGVKDKGCPTVATRTRLAGAPEIESPSAAVVACAAAAPMQTAAAARARTYSRPKDARVKNGARYIVPPSAVVHGEAEPDTLGATASRARQ